MCHTTICIIYIHMKVNHIYLYTYEMKSLTNGVSKGRYSVGMVVRFSVQVWCREGRVVK